MSILWKNPAAASRDGILRSWGCLGYLIQLASLARESAFVKKLQISTTFERSGRPARRRLSFIGSQNPNQTKSTQKGAFCLAGGNTLDRLGTGRNFGQKEGPERVWLQALAWWEIWSV